MRWILWAATAALTYAALEGRMSAFLAIFIWAAVVSLAEAVMARR